MTYEVDVQRLPIQKVAAIRARTRFEDIGETMAGAYQELYGRLATAGVVPGGPPTAVYSEVDHKSGVTVEICVPVSEGVAPEGRVVEDELPDETVVVTLHRGPYDELPKAYAALQDYMEENQLRPSGRMREQYLNGPPNTPPEEYETIVQWPVAS